MRRMDCAHLDGAPRSGWKCESRTTGTHEEWRRIKPARDESTPARMAWRTADTIMFLEHFMEKQKMEVMDKSTQGGLEDKSIT
ncbi:hypothetical protein WISP_102020 [Willisornis vidua]|uniref:Uncharacterized protein n=1 Tax=Willisornis vidua TaxID=1566151 RepID=A0ABQ9CY75_9PASS|nr:hypothetical protein WISP_102020 [Willisornis vidua]